MAGNITCPVECRCSSAQKVYCNSRDLLYVPEGIPADTKALYLQDNLLTNSADVDRALSKLHHLEKLMLYNNNLETIPQLDAPWLRELRLNNNR